MPPLKTDYFHCNGVCDLVLEGHASIVLDPLEHALNRIMALRPQHVRIDLGQLQSISSLTMGMLVAFRRSIVRRGGEVTITAVHPRVLEALQRTRLDDLFGLTTDPAAVA